MTGSSNHSNKQEHRRLNYWYIVLGTIVSAIVIITTVASIAAGIIGNNDVGKTNKIAAESDDTPPPDTPPNTGTSAPSSPSSSSADPAAVYREGDLIFQRETYPTDFDAAPTDPQWGRNSPTAWPGEDDLGTTANDEVTIRASLGAQLASPQGAPLSYSSCTGANFSGESVPLMGLPSGEVICIRTTEERYAGMQLLSTEGQKYTFHVVTWKSGVGY